MKHTMERINALRWFHAREPVGWFDRTAPNHSMRSRLEKRGLIERVPDSRAVYLTKFRLTAEGLAILADAGWL